MQTQGAVRWHYLACAKSVLPQRICIPLRMSHLPEMHIEQKRKLLSSMWNLASWNVRSLWVVEGSVRTARSDHVIDTEDKRIDQVVSELGRYGVVVAALQETKWFGDEMYRVGESVVLAAGRPVPGDGQVKKR